MRIIILVVFIFFSFQGFSQILEGTVYGNEKDGEIPLPGVNIYWKGTKEGVASKDNGTFRIEKRDNTKILIFSFVGYKTREIEIDKLSPVKVILNPNIELKEVTVVHKNRGTYLSTINPIQSENINGTELHKAACCNLAESFETNPSVDVSYSDAVTGAKQIRLLGLEGIYSLLQIENMPSLRGLATSYGLTYVPGPWMESIQVSKGAASVVNGYESIAGQINAEYKKPDSQEKLFLNAFSGASGKVEFNGNGNIRFNDKLATGIFASVSSQLRRNDHNNDGFLDEPLTKMFQIFNRWKFNNHNGFMAQAAFNVLSDDRLGGESSFRKDMQNIITNPYGISIDNQRIEGFLKAGYAWPDNKTALAWLSNFSRHETESFYGLTDYNAQENRFYGSAVLTRDIDREGEVILNAGVSYIFDKFDEILYDRNIKRTESVPGVFAEITWKPSHDFTLMTGIRTDFHNLFGTFFTPRMHFRYSINNHFTFRGSAGKGYRTANVISENNYLLANSRILSWKDDAYQEKAWNFGFAFIQKYDLWNRDLQINSEFFRTDFQSQLVVDRESSSSNIILSPLDGKSYSNSLQFDIRYEPIKRLDLLLAYRHNDVKQTINGKLVEKPLTNRYKGLINLNYTTNLKKWMFDYTVQFNGGGRLPQIRGSVIPHANEFSPYIVMNAQITKYFRYWNIYAGVENFNDFKQDNPINSSSDPFDSQFDATNIWGPITGRKIYAGLRFTLNYDK